MACLRSDHCGVGAVLVTMHTTGEFFIVALLPLLHKFFFRCLRTASGSVHTTLEELQNAALPKFHIDTKLLEIAPQTIGI